MTKSQNNEMTEDDFDSVLELFQRCRPLDQIFAIGAWIVLTEDAFPETNDMVMLVGRLAQKLPSTKEGRFTLALVPERNGK